MEVHMRQSFTEIKSVMFNDYNERGFCTVAAIAMAMDWSAGKAHRYMKRFGRPNRCGPSAYAFHNAVEGLKEHGVTLHHIASAEGMTLNRFCKEWDVGTYIVMVYGHALTVIDGVPQDWTADTAMRRKIGYRTGGLCCWRVVK
jgi:hypothetical protein